MSNSFLRDNNSISIDEELPPNSNLPDNNSISTGEELPPISNENLLHLGELLTCNAQGDGDQLIEVDASNKGTDSNQNPTKNRKCNHGFLSQIGLHQRDLSSMKEKMYKIHLNVTNRLSKLKTKLEFKGGEIKTLQYLYKKDLFHVIERDLNDVTKNFIHSQLKHNNKKSTQRKWTVDDKAFFLSWCKRSPKMYTYLSSFFILPSIHLLKGVLSKIPFDASINESVIANLKRNVRNMTKRDRYCSLLFDEFSLHSGLYYDEMKQKLIGYADIGHLGRSIRRANHAFWRV